MKYHFNKKSFVIGLFFCVLTTVPQILSLFLKLEDYYFVQWLPLTSLVLVLVSAYCFISSGWGFKVYGHRCVVLHKILYTIGRIIFIPTFIFVLLIQTHVVYQIESIIVITCLISSSAFFTFSMIYGSEEEVEQLRDVRL